MKLSYLWHGLPGHPLHPPLTDVVIGAYTAGTVMAFASVIGVAHKAAAYGWWLALVVGLLATSLAALTGFAEWLTLTWRSPLWWTATWHMCSMLTATVFFLIAVLVGHSGYSHGAVEAGPFVLTLVGFLFLTVGGWLGGAVVFVHGMRVLSLVDEPTKKAVTPEGPEKKQAEAR